MRPLGAPDGSEGYEVTTERPGAWLRRDRRTLRARGVVIAAGALGTNKLLRRCKRAGSLPRVSDRLGRCVRTNSEAILAVTLPKDAHGPDQARRDHLERLPRPRHAHRDRHLRRRRRLDEPALHADGRRRHARHAAAEAARHDRCATRCRLLRTISPRGWSRRTIIVLVHADARQRDLAACPSATLRGGVRLQTEQDPERPNPTFIPVANHFAAWLAERTGGIAQSSIMEAVAQHPERPRTSSAAP